MHDGLYQKSCRNLEKVEPDEVHVLKSIRMRMLVLLKLRHFLHP